MSTRHLPGWYPDPDRPGRERLWDGQAWTHHLRRSAGRGRFSPRTIGLAVGGGVLGLLVIIVGLVASGSDRGLSGAARSSTTPASSGPAPATSAVSTPTAKPTPEGRPGTALAAAQKLQVKKATTKQRYSRQRFGDRWSDVDHNACDQRNDVLRRDLRKLHTVPDTGGCVLAKGRLTSPYSGKRVTLVRSQSGASAVEIDHVVSLRDAWRTGAQHWTAGKRAKFANDFLNLVAVDATSSERKHNGNAAAWLPPRESYRCAYVARQVAVKRTYRLWVTPAEQAAMVDVLSACPDKVLPKEKSTKVPRPQPIGEPKPKPKPRQSPPPSERSAPQTVHPGAFCSSEGATGVTNRGTPMVCTSKAGDRARWRAR